MAPLGTWLRLVRAANCVTAVADVCAGAALAQAVAGASLGLGRLALAAGASMCVYAGGCALNDWADLPSDRIKKKDRPLPSGAIGPGVGLLAAALLLAAAIGLGTLAGTPTLLAVCLIAGAAIGYDVGMKRSRWLGAGALAVARGGNCLLGAVAAADGWPGGSPYWMLGPLLLGAYVAGVTLVSTLEEAPGRGRLAAFGLLPIAVVASVPFFGRGHPGAWMAVPPAAAAVVLLALALARALRRPAPETVGGTVRAGVLSMPLLDAALAWGVAQWTLGTVTLALAVAARLLARRFPT